MALNRQLGNSSFSLAQEPTREWMKQYLTYDKFSDIRGKNFGNVIVTKGVTQGNTVAYDMAQTYLDLVSVGYNGQISGTGKEPSFASYYNKIGPVSFAAGISEIQFESLVMNKDFKPILQNMLTAQASYNLFRRTIQAFYMGACFKTTTSLTDFTLAPKIYDYDDIVGRVLASTMVVTSAAANAVPGDVMSHNRIVLGNDVNNNAGAPTNATIAIALAGGGTMNGVLGPNTGATLNHFRKMRQIATIGMRVGNKSVYMENAIKGIRSDNDQMGYMTDNMIALISEGTAEYLQSTAEWQAQVNRAVIEDKAKQPSIYRGSSYLGTINGVIFIKDPELDKYALNATTHISFMFGANAIAHSLGSYKITAEKTNHEKRFEIAYHEDVGIRPFMFPSTSDGNNKGDLNKLLVSNYMIGVAKIA